MTVALERMSGPVPLATTSAAFDAATLAHLDSVWTDDAPWVRHDTSFYRCFIAERDDLLPMHVRQALREQVSAALGLDLCHDVRVTAQRMEPGDGAERHTDRPLVGYEAARFITQLDTPRGGRFRMLEPAGPEAYRAWLDRPAVRNQAVAFELCAASHHEVSPCESPRRTLVVHFWHRANPPQARDLVHRWLAPMTFASLPASLDEPLATADATMDDDRTGVAGRVAWLVADWGSDALSPPDLVDVFERALRGAPPATEVEARARFVVRLLLDAFDRDAFEALSATSRQWWLEALSAEPIQ